MARAQAFLRHFLRQFLLALHATTRLPLAATLAPLPARDGPADAGTAHLPGAGLLVGAVASVSFAAASLPLPESTAGTLAAALLSTIATVLLTGALQERGLARTVQRLDPRDDAGFGGTLALVLVVATKVALLAVLASQSAAGVLATLLAGHAVARCWPLVLGAAQTPAHRGDLLVGALWCLPALALMGLAGGPVFPLLAVAASGLAFVVLVRRYRRRLQGESETEDGLAALRQVCEVAFYLGAAFGLRG